MELDEQALTSKLVADAVKLAKRLDRYGVSRWELVAKAQASTSLHEVAWCRDQLAEELARLKGNWFNTYVWPWAEMACAALFPLALFASMFLVAAFVKFGMTLLGG